MLEVQNFKRKNFMPPQVSEKNLPDKNNVGDLVIFTQEEWQYFVDEVNKQIESSNEPVDFGRAARNARYLAKLDRGFKQMAEGGGVFFTDEEWEKFVNEQEIS